MKLAAHVMKKFRKPVCRESPFHFFDGADLIQQQLAKATKQDFDQRTTPAASFGVSKKLMRIYPKDVTPECLYPGSSPNIPLDSR
jgi:hypothetical protein